MALSLKHAMTICKIIANITLAVFFCYAIKKIALKNITLKRMMTHMATITTWCIDTFDATLFDATFQSLFFSHHVCASFLLFVFIVYVYRSLCLVIAIKGKVFYGSVDQHWHCAVCGW